MAKTRTKFKELLGKITFGNGTDIIGSEPTKNTVSESITGQNLFDYLIKGVNFTWLKLKDLFSVSNTNNNYIPKIDDVNKKLVKSNIQDDGTTPKYGANTIWHSGNDGSDSGLDADLLDGKHASDLANRTIKVDSIDKAGSETTIPINFVSTDDIIVQGFPSGFGLDISFSSKYIILVIIGLFQMQYIKFKNLLLCQTNFHSLKLKLSARSLLFALALQELT